MGLRGVVGYHGMFPEPPLIFISGQKGGVDIGWRSRYPDNVHDAAERVGEIPAKDSFGSFGSIRRTRAVICRGGN